MNDITGNKPLMVNMIVMRTEKWYVSKFAESSYLPRGMSIAATAISENAEGIWNINNIQNKCYGFNSFTNLLHYESYPDVVVHTQIDIRHLSEMIIYKCAKHVDIMLRK